jgi:hypothetical protein
MALPVLPVVCFVTSIQALSVSLYVTLNYQYNSGTTTVVASVSVYFHSSVPAQPADWLRVGLAGSVPGSRRNI